MSDVIQFEYEGQSISFEFADGNKMINATEMARPFKGKQVGGFLRLRGTKEYILLLEERYADLHIGKKESEEPAKREVLRVVKGGDRRLQGTWMDEKLALKFAAWLSPRFELWVYDRIEELLLTGKTELASSESGAVTLPTDAPSTEILRPNPSGLVKSLRIIVEQLEEQERFNEEIRHDVDFIADRVDELEAKITSSDDRYYTIAGYCALHKIPCPLASAKKWGKAATLLSRERDIPTGTAHDERYGKVRTYHEEVLKEVVGS